MKRTLVALLTFALAATAFAQSPLVESIEVRVANIDVVVRDRAGNPVNGLTKNDFELYEDGALQPLTNFYEIRRGEETAPEAVAGSAQKAEEAPQELVQRRAVLFFDAASLAPAAMKSVLLSVTKFIDSMRPEDRAMIVVWHLGARVITPFTNDKAALHAGLDELKKFAPTGNANDRAAFDLRRRIETEYQTAASEQGTQLPAVTFDGVWEDGKRMIERYSLQLETEQLQMLDAVREISARMSGLEGKKILVFVCQTLAEKPGSDLYRWLENLLRSQIGNLQELELAMENSGRMGDALDKLARDVSANGVTIYAVGAATNDGGISAESTLPVDQTYTFAREANTSASLQNIAEGTGGIAVTRTTNFDLAFDTIARDLGSYYSLGYKPSPGTHKIRVVAKNRAYTVRTRNTFASKSTDDQMTDRTVSNLYTDAGRNEWPISIRFGQPQPDGKSFLVPVQIVIPSTITMLPQNDGRLGGGFTLYFVAASSDGNISPVLRRPQTFTIPAGTEQTLRAKPMTFSTGMKMKRGENMLSVAIIDQISGVQGFARAPVTVK